MNISCHNKNEPTFYSLLADHDLPWAKIAHVLNVSSDQVRRKVQRQTLSLEDSVVIVRESQSPTLLLWVLQQMRPEFREKPH